MSKCLILLATACYCLLSSRTTQAQGANLSLQKGIAIGEYFESFSHDGRYMSSVDKTGNGAVYDIRKGVLINRFSNIGLTLKWLPDSRHLGSWSNEYYAIKIVNSITKEVIGSYSYPLQAIAANGSLLAFPEQEATLDSLKALRGKLRMQQWVNNPDVTFTDTVQLNELMSLKQPKIDSMLQRYQRALADHPGGIIRMLNPMNGQISGIIQSGLDDILNLLIDPQGNKIAIFGTRIDTSDNEQNPTFLQIIDTKSSDILLEKEVFSSYYKNAIPPFFSPTGRYLVYYHTDEWVLLDVQSGEELYRFQSYTNEDYIRFGQDDRYLLSISQRDRQDTRTITLFKNEAQIYDIQNRKQVCKFSLGAYFFDINPEFTELAYWNYTPGYPQVIERKLYFIDLNTGKEKELTIPGDYGSQGLRYSPDGKYLLFARDGQLVYWDRKLNREIKKSDSEGLQVMGSTMHSDLKKILISTTKGVWSLHIDKDITVSRLPVDTAQFCYIDNRGENLIYGGYLFYNKYTINTYSIASSRKRQIAQIDIDGNTTIQNISVEPAGGYFAASIMKWKSAENPNENEYIKYLHIGSVLNGEQIGTLPLGISSPLVPEIIWAKDSRHLYYISNQPLDNCDKAAYQNAQFTKLNYSEQTRFSVRKVNISNGKYEACSGSFQSVTNFQLSPSGQYLAILDRVTTTKVSHVVHILSRDLKLISKIELKIEDNMFQNVLSFNEKEDSLIVFYSGTNSNRILYKKYALTSGLAGVTHEIKGVEFMADMMVSVIDRYMLIRNADGEINVVDVDAKKLLYRLTLTGADDYLLYTPDNYYLATKNAINAVRFNKSDASFPFRQFDLIYNRPDIVLSRMGTADPALVDSYRRAYEKRVKKMGFRQEQLSADARLPELLISSPDLPFETNQSLISLQVKASDKQYDLDRINVWVNDVPLFGVRGIELRGKKTRETVQDIAVPLSYGNNKIEISCYNEKGLESLLEEVEINYTAPVAKPNLFLAVLGASKYAQAEMNLQYAAKDAIDVADLFEKKQSDYAAIQIKKFTDQDITRDKLPEIRRWLEQSGVNDQVIVFFAGHGLISDSLDYYLATYDTDFANPSGRGISYESLESLLDGIPARNKLMLMDACHSGEIDKESVAVSRENKTTGGNVTFRSFNTGLTTTQVGLENSFELMKSLFVDLRRSSGATAIASAGAAEYAVEGSAWQNGVFTYCLLKGLRDKEADRNRDGAIILSELQQYLSQKVPELTEGRQRPAFRLENIANDWKVW